MSGKTFLASPAPCKAGDRQHTDWLLSCPFLLCDRLFEENCPKLIIVIKGIFNVTPYQDCIITQS